MSGERLVLTEPFGTPAAVVDLGMAIDKDGSKVTTPGAEIYAVAQQDWTQKDIDANLVTAGNKRKLTGVTLGTCMVLLGGTVNKGDKLAVDSAAKFQVATAGQHPAVIAREGGGSGKLIEAFVLPQRRRPNLTNSTGATPGSTLAAGVGIETITLLINLASIGGSVDVLTSLVPGYKFKILSHDAFVVIPVTTGSKAASINLEIGSTDVTGGVVALTSANSTPLGAKIAGTAITALNTGSATDAISLEASAVTAFAEGQVLAQIRIQNLDTAEAVASLNAA